MFKRHAISIVFMVLVTFFSDAQVESGNSTDGTYQCESVLTKMLINNTFWTQWGHFSTFADFAEINFLTKHVFLFKRGIVNKYHLKKDTVIYESYSGIWSIKDSVITMIHSNPIFGTIEHQLKMVHLNELLVIDFPNLVGQSHTFIRKPCGIRLSQR
jgi:hypothetical protein